MAQIANQQELLEDNRRAFRQFLANEDEYVHKVQEMIASSSSRLEVNLQDLKRIAPDLPNKLLKDPTSYIQPFEEALAEVIANDDPAALKTMKSAVHVAFAGAFGRHSVTPRGLSASLVSKMVCVEGIVTKCGVVHPKLVRSAHYAPVSGELIVREHRTLTDLSKSTMPSQGGVPKQDSEGNPVEVEFGLCTYKDQQRLTVQEMPERAPTGQMPRSVEVLCENDLVDGVKPGDRVQIVGVYRPLTRRDGYATSGVFKAVLVANNLSRLRMELIAPTMSPGDIRAIKEIGSMPDTLELLGRSFAPSICGHEVVKKGLVLLLIGGVEKNLSNGTHIRGDLHLLMLGDPSCGKSQMLRFVLNLAPLAISTTGRGSSGVGLTAAITVDRDTNERRLEAGAMVLADRGVVCIDEFDKMSNVDRVAIHEVMEQQTVTIAKAGIHTSLNARASVVAAANPLYGNWDESIQRSKQIAFPDSLLSRFDLIFLIRDAATPESDRRIASHVLKQLQYRKPGDTGQALRTSGQSIIEVEPEKEDRQGEEAPVFEKVHLAPTNQKDANGNPLPILTVEFLRKYIHYCRQTRRVPQLSEEAVEEIADYYAALRQACRTTTGERCAVVTTRTLEAAIRLSSAHAKLKLREMVTREDVVAARRLLDYSLGKTTAMDDEPMDVDQPTEVPEAEDRRKRSRATASPNGAAAGTDPSDAKRRRQEDLPELPRQRYRQFCKFVSHVFQQKNADMLDVAVLLEEVNKRCVEEGAEEYTKDQCDGALSKMQSTDNKILIDSEQRLVHLVV